MIKKEYGNYALAALLTVSFPLLWLFNQRINYRGLFQVDSHYLLKAPNSDHGNLSSFHSIIQDFKRQSIKVTLSPKIITSSGYGVVGRVLETDSGNIELYEFESHNQALSALSQQPNLSNTQVVKNILVVKKEGQK